MSDWRERVLTDSTFPPSGTFSKTGEEIAEIMLSPSVSPMGKVSAMRMVSYFLNRGGSKLSDEQRLELAIAIDIIKTSPEIEVPTALFSELAVGTHFWIPPEHKLFIKTSEYTYCRSMMIPMPDIEINWPHFTVFYRP